jgi:hypothetical protein
VEEKKGPDPLEGSEFKDLIRSILEPKKFATVTPTGTNVGEEKKKRKREKDKNIREEN